MIKINVSGDGFPDFEYYSTVPPVIGDTIYCNSEFKTVYKRIICPDNQNFIMIKVK